MRNKYNMQLNPRRLSREDIEQHKDFDALLEEFQQSQPPGRTALRRRLWYLSGAVAAAVAGLLFYFAAGPSPLDRDPVPTPEAYFARQELVEPPLETVVPEFTAHSVDARQGGTYAFGGGSRVVIPSKAFMDDRGRLIEGNVDIHYRELHDYVDFFVAGIPMVYDSADARFFLESSGMVEIFALQDGERLRLAPGKAIEVELVSEIVLADIDAAPRFRVYQLDTVNRRWTYRDVDHEQILEEPIVDPNDPLYWPKTTMLETMAAIESQAAEQRKQIRQSLARPVAPVKPQPLSSDQPSLELDFLEGVDIEGQDRQFYEGTIWQISPTSPDFNPELLSEVWADFQFRPLNNIEYELTLIRGEEQQKITVRPVLSGSDYQNAMNAYEEAYARYEVRLTEYEATITGRLDSLENAVAAASTALRETFETQVDSLLAGEEQFLETGIRRRIVNRFLATSMGIWSCDRLLPLAGDAFQAAFVDQYGKEYRNHTAYLVTRGHNTVFRFYTGATDTLQVDLDSESLLWLVTEDNRIAVLRPRRLREEITERTEVPLLELELIDQEIRSEADVREILRL